MQLTKTVALLALALSGVDALPTQEAPQESSPLLTTRATCKQIFPQPKVYTCDGIGYIKNDSTQMGTPTNQLTVEACANKCHDTAGCESFMYRYGVCTLFKGPFKDMGFFNKQSFSWWYQMECFRC